MKVTVKLDEEGFLPDRFSKFADASLCHSGIPTCSFPFSVRGVPTDASSLALTLVDYDSIPVCGFAWIHWCACGIPADIEEVPENASNDQALGMIQGLTSAASSLVRETDPLVICRYNGPQPPDGTHIYTLTVFALDNEPTLEEGFWMSELVSAMRGHVLASAETLIPARS